jgi:hypothetical protein
MITTRAHKPRLARNLRLILQWRRLSVNLKILPMPSPTQLGSFNGLEFNA